VQPGLWLEIIDLSANTDTIGIMPANNDIETRVVELVHRLPPMPQNVQRLLLAAREQQNDEAELLRLLKEDPGLCVDLLHLANTFYSTAHEHIETVEESVVKIGTQPLIQLMGVWYAKGIIVKEFGLMKHLDEYFKHSQEISLSCRVMSEMMDLPAHECEVHAVAGLIHDIGRLVILLASQRTATHLLGTAWDCMRSVVQEENELLGMNHCEVGMQICKKWSFSPFMQEGILRHHSPLIKDDFSRLGATLFLAHFIASSDFTGEMLAHMLPLDVLDRLNMSNADFQQVRQEYFSRAKQAGA